MTKLANVAPPACASCFQAGSDMLYVDFEAAYDGPVIPGTPEPVPVDDLIICDRCLAEAFVLLDPQNLRDEVARLTDLLEQADKALEDKDRHIQRLGRTAGELAADPPKPRRGSQGFEGVSEEVARTLRERQKHSKAAKRTKTPPKPKVMGPQPKNKAAA